MSIEVKNLTKTYKIKRSNVDEVARNFGTRKYSLMTGILTPDYGTISIDGLNFKKNRKQIMLKIGVVFDQRSVLCWDIPVIESFKLFKDMYHIPEKSYRENMEIFSDILNLLL